MAEVYIFQGPEKLSPVANDRVAIGDSEDVDVDGQPKRKFSKLGNIEALAVQSLTHEEAQSIIDDPDEGLSMGHFYEIIDATTANIPLLLLAISTTSFHTDAKSPDFPQDVIEYDFDNDIIKWRWDTITNILVAQDLRNLSNLTIGTGCTNITLGPGVTGSIGNNCRDITAARACELTIGNDSLYINLGVETIFICGTDAYDLQIGGNTTVILGNFCTKWVIGSGSTVTVGNGNNNFVIGSDTEFVCPLVITSNAVTVSSGCNISNMEHVIINKSFLSGVSQNFTGVAVGAAIFDITYSATVQGSNDGETYITFLTGATATTQLATDPA